MPKSPSAIEQMACFPSESSRFLQVVGECIDFAGTGQAREPQHAGSLSSFGTDVARVGLVNLQRLPMDVVRAAECILDQARANGARWC